MGKYERERFLNMIDAYVKPKADSWFYFYSPSDIAFTVCVDKDSKRTSYKFNEWDFFDITPEELLSKLGLVEEEPKPVEKIRRTITVCPNCGANSWINDSCAYCGTEI